MDLLPCLSMKIQIYSFFRGIKTMKKFQIKNPWRVTLQWIILALLGYMVVRLFVDPNYVADFEAYCPFGGLQALTSFLVNNSLACTMTELQIFMGLALLVGVFVFSKLFCSYICPLGTFTEWLAKLGEKFKVLYTLNGLADRLLRVLKYGLLFITFYFTVGSSELFCKEYDPFYAIFTGFGHDVYLWYALAAIILMVVGSIFVRQFWCKYLCPLGAISNIFSNGFMFIGVLAVYFILRYFGLEISWIWPAAIISILGFVLESARMEGWVFPLLKITRNEDTCTSCGDCDLACPMGIEISESMTVKHIDCHMCGDCLKACPVDNTLQINKRNLRWLPPTATVVLIAIGMYLATMIELPTINIKWGTEQQLETASVFEKSGLKSIKCYGSSMSFASKMKRLKGVLSVEAYVQTNSVKVLYDSSLVSSQDIQKAIFSPTRTMIRKPGDGLQSLAVADLGIDKLFDSFDNFYFTRILSQTEGVFGLSTAWGEPVPAKVYFDPSQVTPDQIKKAIESPTLTYSSRGKEITVDLKFEAHILSDSLVTIDAHDFVVEMFPAHNQAFNKYKSYQKEELGIYRVYMPQAGNPRFKRSMTYLVSHISTSDNVVRFQTVYEDRPYAHIYFVKGKIETDSIYADLNKAMLTVHYSNGKTGEVENPFKFPENGVIIE